MGIDTAIKIGKLRLKNPVMVASGTFGAEYEHLVAIRSLGALVTKTITRLPRLGSPPPRLIETASGMLNAIGLENKGFDDFVRDKMGKFNALKVPLIVSIGGHDENEFKELAKDVSKVNGVDGLEINLSCPNIKDSKGKRSIVAQDEKATHRIVSAVRKATRLTVIAKLSPNVTDVAQIAKAAEAAGADALSLINTLIGMAVDIDTRRPVLGNVTGGLSGPAIKPIALRMVWEVFKKVKVPIIGIGGIMDSTDALEFIMCGASAVQVGTANFVNPQAATDIIKGIEGFLRHNKIANVKKLVGSLETNTPSLRGGPRSPERSEGKGRRSNLA